MTNIRRFRYKLADWISEASWHWHIPAFFFTFVSFSALPKSLWLLIFPAISIGLVIMQWLLRRDFRKLRSNASQVKISHINDMYLLLDTGFGTTQTLTQENIEKVVFYKTDEITMDLICCEVEFQKKGQFERIILHEELEQFESFERWIAKLPNFDVEWRAKVIQPPIAESFTTAFHRKSSTILEQ